MLLIRFSVKVFLVLKKCLLNISFLVLFGLVVWVSWVILLLLGIRLVRILVVLNFMLLLLIC